ncbi:transcription elongation factor [Lasallia pustulata]|uniref:Transcription elongation factor 1 homolog n=1 Tax=Lasallia pustulata TaxID=136370 RepID=A0A1W5D7A3_9LECA|nr:transcription elongation factor [Lasallia pustulata]
MGKRKKSSRKPQGPKKKEPLPTAFPCLFCNHEKSVSVEMNKKAGTGELSCKVCGQQFQTGINYLSAAVDVYSDWIDACDTVAKEAAEASRIDPPHSYSDLAAGAGGRRNSDMQIDRHLVAAVDDEEDGQGDYGDE